MDGGMRRKEILDGIGARERVGIRNSLVGTASDNRERAERAGYQYGLSDPVFYALYLPLVFCLT